MPAKSKRYVVYYLDRYNAWTRTAEAYVSRREAYAKANFLLKIYGRTKVEEISHGTP